MTTVYFDGGPRLFPKVSQCLICQHRIEAHTCRAYPQGIPERIYDNALDHREAQAGDSGLRYQFDAARAEAWHASLSLPA